MAQLNVDVGGRPGFDCLGFCEYCYFKGAKDTPPFGCRYCLPFTKGCDYCSRSVKEGYSGFLDLKTVANTVLADLQMLTDDLTRVTISGGGDPSCYPELYDLVDLLGKLEAPLHIGYTSGKGFSEREIGRHLVDNNLTEISYTIFSADPEKRRRYMRDPSPEISLQVLEDLSGEIDLYAAAVIIPGVNDGGDLTNTCEWLDERGAKGLILMRFANSTNQGLILGNAPIIKGVEVQTVESFRDMVRDLNESFGMKISGTPLYDPEIGSPFAILNEPELLEKLPLPEKRASVVTGSIAAPFIRKILDKKGFKGNVIAVDKEISCLITIDDFSGIESSDLEELVVIPGRAFVHDMELQQLLGMGHRIIRGPEMLTADAETSMGMNRNGVLNMEIEGFSELINTINRNGV